MNNTGGVWNIRVASHSKHSSRLSLHKHPCLLKSSRVRPERDLTRRKERHTYSEDQQDAGSACSKLISVISYLDMQECVRDQCSTITSVCLINNCEQRRVGDTNEYRGLRGP